jgi:BirA family transcriptional regulator, biotin operon repressor / biotin---[acetyl-CoA-carboxylase] ligase
MEQARTGAPAGLVAVADHQTAGRGRLGRSWEAPPGASLLTSILLRPDLASDRRHLVTAAVALAGADAIDDAGADLLVSLKWPNDLLVGGRKVAGVLAEADAGAVVVGIGINLNWEGDPPANGIAVNQVIGRPVDRDEILAALLNGVDARHGNWTDVAKEHRRRCSTIGRQVRVELADETFVGNAADVDDDGHLLVDVGMCLRSVSAADVVHLR